jgi:DNA-binding XRE family transcriptional regulator
MLSLRQTCRIQLRRIHPDDTSLSTAIHEKLTNMGFPVRLLNDEGLELFTFEEVFPDAKPGMILRGFRIMEGMMQKELAEKLETAQTRVSEMERGKRTISINMSKKLAKIFNTSYKCFL